MDVEALRAKTQEIDDQLFRMRIQKSMGRLEAPGKMRTIRRERARILTVLKEKAK
jgi:ribosomal protein L29